MPGYQSPKWRSLWLRLGQIERVYGSGNFDDAGDDIVAALRQVSDYPNQHRYLFETDLSHPNPWYHVLIFENEGISDPVYGRFFEQVVGLSLINFSDCEPGA